MAKDEKKFLCRVETIHGEALSTEAVSVVFPALDGQAGVLAGCGPIASALGAGPLSVRTAGGETLEYFVAGGFAQVRDNVATILAEQCVPAGDLKAEAAETQLQQALGMPARPAPAAEAKEWAVRVARARVRQSRKAAD